MIGTLSNGSTCSLPQLKALAITLTVTLIFVMVKSGTLILKRISFGSFVLYLITLTNS